MLYKKRRIGIFVRLAFVLAALGAFLFSAGTVYAQPAGDVPAANAFRVTDLPLPRFVSLRSDKAYVRAGPALRYPIKWIYQRDGLPLEIVQEFDNWRKVRDYDGDEGWIHQSLLSGTRTALTAHSDAVALYRRDDMNSRVIARIEPLVTVRLEECVPDMCRVEVGNFEGWIERKMLWGIYEREELD